jgi:hypothetical protein
MPTTWEHVERYPLSALPEEDRPQSEPIVLGLNWYEKFFEPVRRSDGSYWIGLGDNWGAIAGGHAICVKPDRVTDLGTWHEYYDQQRNSCVGFSASRSRTLIERRKYNGEWLYDRALERDEWPGTKDQGTSVDAGFKVLRELGPCTPAGYIRPLAGVSAYRWLTDVSEVAYVLDSPTNETRQAVKLVNSWGLAWPHFVWLPYLALERLLIENGEAVTATSR